jgi:hypothetical protein
MSAASSVLVFTTLYQSVFRHVGRRKIRAFGMQSRSWRVCSSCTGKVAVKQISDVFRYLRLHSSRSFCR